ncbi:MAG TPA: type II toxin-antitoxin system prevent-host-death family antitoxin [Candidatus Saccharimonadales bacterium]|nr:type II toxin-antitoxin system prevent-host-death family antitoxin [Candidatus Saccharimonadales bacterium]
MERVGVRELRNYTSRVVARARAGERIVITVDGVPAAEIGPIVGPSHERTMAELVAGGLVIPPRTGVDRSARPHPVRLPGNRTASGVVIGERGRD